MGGSLAGKTAIITGAASGIGRASARLFAEEGAEVLAVDMPSSNLAATAAGSERIFALQQDVAVTPAPARIIGKCMDRWGKLDILFNNAGVGINAPVSEMTDADWDRTIAVNLTAQFRLSRAAIPLLKASPAGRIINTASVMARYTDFGLAAYCASKAGVAGMTRNLALELGKFGITANFIEPGAIETGMTAASFSNTEIAAIWAKKSVLKRLGQPSDIAKGAAFLASDAASFITGHGLTIDGGLMLRT